MTTRTSVEALPAAFIFSQITLRFLSIPTLFFYFRRSRQQLKFIKGFCFQHQIQEMASKRKSHASKCQHIPGRIELRNQKRDLLANRGFVHGRVVDLRSLKDFYVQEAFEQIGWETFLNLSGNVKPTHIREFYAGYIYNEPKGTIELQMYDKFYTWTLDQFCNFLQLPRAENQLYTSVTNLDSISTFVSRPDLIRAICEDNINPETTTQISDQSLLENVKVWNKIILANIFPRGGNTDRLAALQAYLLYCLAQAIKVDIGYIVAKRMDGIVITNRKLPYGLLLNRLFDHLDLPPCPTEVPGAGINGTTIRRMDIAKKSNGKGKENVGESSEPRGHVNMDVDDELAIVPHEEVPPSQFGRSEDWRNVFQPCLARLEREVGDIRQDVKKLRQEVCDQSDLMHRIWDRVQQFPFTPN